jgi:hypothetical protein
MISMAQASAIPTVLYLDIGEEFELTDSRLLPRRNTRLIRVGSGR